MMRAMRSWFHVRGPLWRGCADGDAPWTLQIVGTLWRVWKEREAAWGGGVWGNE